MVKSCGVVVVVAHEILLSSPGTGGTPYSHFPGPISHFLGPKSQSQSLDKKESFFCFGLLFSYLTLPSEVSNQSNFLSHIATTSERGGEADACPHLTAQSHFRHSASVAPRPAQEAECVRSVR